MADPKPDKRPDRPNSGRPNRGDGGEEAPKPAFSGGWILILLIIGAILYFMYQQNPQNQGTTVSYSFFHEQMQQQNLKEVLLQGNIITGEWKAIPEETPPGVSSLQKSFNTAVPPSVLQDDTLIAAIQEQNPDAEISAKPVDGGLGSQLILWMIGPLLIIGFLWIIMRRNADPMGGGMMGNFIRSQARRFNASEQRTTFEDVAAMQQAKMELEEIVEFLKNPKKFLDLGAQIPKGVLLMGSPGTGKTLLARATAGEAGVPFYSINGSEFIQMFVGVGASRVRDLFRTAKDNAPCIVFVDEIDAVGRVRGAGVGGGHDEREQTLNQILSEMDGFTPSEAVIVIAATNRPDVLDPALLRPGRFDRHIAIDRPTREGRLQILKVHTRNVKIDEAVDLADVAAGTIGFSGAELKNLVNEAALNAARSNRKRVVQDDFDYARDRVLMGTRREEVLNEHEKEMTAYHEAGHALLGWLLPDADAVHKVTIVPRGRALGVTQFLPDEERYSVGEKRLRTQLIVGLGGRAAEKLIFDEYTAGAENDLKQCTNLARRMIANWGMSENIGPVYFNQAEEHPFLGREMHEHRTYSDETARIIDQEVQSFLLGASEQAKSILAAHREELKQIVDALLTQESIDRKQLEEMIGVPNQLDIDSMQNGHDNKNHDQGEGGE